MIKKIGFVVLVITLLLATGYILILFGPKKQSDPGLIQGAYFLESSKGKVIVINDYTSEIHGYRAARSIRTGWLISLDAATGKELTRAHTGRMKYVGRDDGKIWLQGSDTSVNMHSRDPHTLSIVDSHESLLSRAEAKNLNLKGKIALWEPEEDYGVVLITTSDASHYYMNPVTLDAHKYDTQNRKEKDKIKLSGLSSVGIKKLNKGDYVAYKDGLVGKNIYMLDGDESILYHLDKYDWDLRGDHAYPSTAPSGITKKTAVNDTHFIKGAFVYDAFTKQPLCFNDDGKVFIYHLDRLGKEQHNILTQVDATGAIKTQYDVTQTDPTQQLEEAFIADKKLYLVFKHSVQCRDASGKMIWQYNENTLDK